MKKNNHIKIFSFILCLVFLLGAFTLVTGAKEEKYVPVEWQLDENLEYLIGGNKRYERYYAYGRFYGDADSVFYFSNGAIYDGKYCEVYGDSADPHIVSVRTQPGYSSIFVDAEGKKILDSFLDRTDCVYYLEYLEAFGASYSKVGEDFVEYLETAYNKGTGLKTVDVRELGEAKIYEITVHDKTETKAYQHGAIYIMPNGRYYYVCFEALDNTYFDADGYFSYRSGSVKAFEITDKTRLKSINTAIDAMTPKMHDSLYEDYVIMGYYDVNGNEIKNELEVNAPSESAAIISFVVMSILVGIIVPSVLLVFSIVFANRRKTTMPKCWYAISVCAAVWIASAILFIILVVI